MAKKKKGKQYVSLVLGRCPVVTHELEDGTKIICGRPLIYPFEVRADECIECRGLRRWRRYHRNPDAFAYKTRASKDRMYQLEKSQRARARAVTV